MKEQVRNTQKSRMVSEIADSIVSMVVDGDMSPSKTKVTEAITKNSLSSNVSSAIYTTVFSEVANEVERYFTEACAKASEELMYPDYHLVTPLYYQHFKGNVPPTPQTKLEARKYVCMFGNGKRGKSAGVRFVKPQESGLTNNEADPMFLVYAEKSTEVGNSSIRSHLESQKSLLESSQLPEDSKQKIIGGLGIKARIALGA